MVVSTVTGKLASAADRLMHAAQYLEGVAKNIQYDDPIVWKSNNPAVIILRERYQFLSDMLDHIYLSYDLERV